MEEHSDSEVPSTAEEIEQSQRKTRKKTELVGSTLEDKSKNEISDELNDVDGLDENGEKYGDLDKQEVGEEKDSETADKKEDDVVVKRKRGRPPGRSRRKKEDDKMDMLEDMDESLFADERSDDEEEVVTKKRRGRPPGGGRRPRGRRKKTPDTIKLPSTATEGLSESLAEELQHAYEIYLKISAISKVSPFVDQPNTLLFGMSYYNTIVKKPMWLNEIKRKLLNKCYDSITEFVVDVRQMLENCYKFWGPSHRFTDKALQIEYKMEQRIQTLPEQIKIKCKDVSGKEDSLDSLERLSGGEDITNDSEKFSDTQSKCEYLSYRNYTSKILKRVMESEDCEKSEEEILELKKKEEIMFSWEKDFLVSQETKSEIISMWQLPAIGLFLKLTYESLNIKEIAQYEVERMLLMPQESTTLATLLTSMLSPAVIRPKLDATVPIMPYEIWNRRLQKKVQDWFAAFYKSGDEIETFEMCGIEPLFWSSMCLINPYEDKNFHELTFFQRAWILKALCDHLYHMNKSIQDLFPDDLSGNEVREVQLGISNNYMYFYLPFWPDIRVYRQRLIPSQMWSNMKDIGFTTGKLLQRSVSFSFEDNEQVCSVSTVQKPLIEDFCLVAESYDDLLALVEDVKESSPELSRKVKQFSQIAKEYTSSTEPMERLYDQWHDYHSRPEEFSKMVTYWESNNQLELEAIKKTEEPEILGKRQRKINVTTNLSSSESEEDIFQDLDDDAGSDWECPSERKKNKKVSKPLFENLELSSMGEHKPEKPKKKRAPKKKATQPKRPVSPGLIAKNNNSPKSNDTCSVIIKTVQSIKPSLTVKPDHQLLEPKKEVESFPLSEEIIIKEEIIPKEEPDTEPSPEENPVITKQNNEVKEEKVDEREEVISLSSEEDDVIVTTPVKAPTPIPAVNKTPPVTPTMKQVRGWTRGNSPMGPRPNSGIIMSPRGGPTPQMRSPVMRSPNVSPQNVRMPPTRIMPSPMSSPSRGYSPRQRMTSPMAPSPLRTPANFRSQNPASRQLFGQQTPNNTPRAPADSVATKLTIGRRDDGSVGYIARLPDGGVINLTTAEVNEIKRKNNGTIPPIVHIPLVKSRFY